MGPLAQNKVVLVMGAPHPQKIAGIITAAAVHLEHVSSARRFVASSDGPAVANMQLVYDSNFRVFAPQPVQASARAVVGSVIYDDQLKVRNGTAQHFQPLDYKGFDMGALVVTRHHYTELWMAAP